MPLWVEKEQTNQKEDILKGYEIHVPASYRLSLLLAQEAKEEKQILSFFMSFFLRCTFRKDYGMLWNASVLLWSSAVKGKEISRVLDKPKAGLKISLMLPLQSCEYPSKTTLQAPQLGKDVMLPCTPSVVTKNDSTYKRERL